MNDDTTFSYYIEKVLETARKVMRWSLIQNKKSNFHADIMEITGTAQTGVLCVTSYGAS